MLKWIGRIFLLLLVATGLFIANTVWFKPYPIRFFYERVFFEFALESPELLSSLHMLEAIGIDGHNAKLDDASEAAGDKQFARLHKNIEMLHSYDSSGMTGQDKLSYDILDWFLQTQAEGERWRYHNYPVNQLFGVQNGFPSFMASTHQVNNLKDGEYYNARLAAVKAKFEQVLEGLKIREQKGIIPPTFVIDKVLAEMNEFVAQKPEDNILYKSLADKLGKLKDVDEAAKGKLLADAKTSIESTVYPAYRLFIDYFIILKPKSSNDAGVWKFPDGEAYYAYELKQNTTTDLNPEQIHQLGLEEVARIQTQMLEILHAQGYQGEDIGELVHKLGEEPRFLYPDSKEGREQILADYKKILDEVSQGLDSAFRVKPKAAMDVQRIPEFKEKTAPGAYYEHPAMDGSRPGIFYANLYDIKATPKFDMRTLAYHEGIPGHHFQIAIQQELQGLPTFRSLLPFTAYAEGWALYSERLAWELGFQKDPFDDLGRLQAELFRAVRLVVDTGIHQKRWTREQAIDYMAKNTGMVLSDVTAEIERYIVMPGQACAYKVGMLKILELREKAKQELGAKFDLRDFHDVVLKNGSVPLAILERVVKDYIASKKA
ncbi:MAG: DUF885 domain-containing protein [Gammaproteobacteria bacterium]|nr:DUF885 domain-containing protein [Gammaproteobacteria bacterium]